ncbi:hypothetical protein NOGI109294_26590 [Nocardiopsis gilva]
MTSVGVPSQCMTGTTKTPVVTLEPCSEPVSRGQTWQAPSETQVSKLRNMASGGCLAPAPYGPLLGRCDGAPPWEYDLLSGQPTVGQIRIQLPQGEGCLEARSSGGPIGGSECAPTNLNQSWLVTPTVG